MNLCIDQGNSRTKVALFREEDGQLVKTFVYKAFSSVDAERLCTLYPVHNCIISSVAHTDPAVLNALNRRSNYFVLFDHTTPVPIKNLYDTPQTLGQDRLAAAVGANVLYPNENVLIVDIGSAITYDYLNENNEYVGGNIAPGIKMRLLVLHQMTKRLPVVEVEEGQLLPLFGHNTRDAIAAGVLRGVIFEVKGYMRTMQERVEHYKTILTGGNAPMVYPNLSTEVQVEKHLVLIGLNRILQFCIEKSNN